MSGSDGVFTVAKGRVGHYAGLPAADDVLVGVLLQADGLEDDSVLADHDTLASVLSGGNAECDFTGYVRQVLAGVAWVVDDDAGTADGSVDVIVWPSAGGAHNNAVGKLLICYRPAAASTDEEIVPLTFHSVDVETNGSTVRVRLPSGFVRVA
ncbi:hypothetical protein SAMN04489712_105282 [Thermomonospora echinospora]|uniref:Uncharacterized protein n=1 Tax=Thermomonospora echinospora TaxID=1992 RepID=A0A1H6A9H2_9ACTN|nr:hypothetical protein [Thermomonospora echinospora]SEG45012.1 hypothetical protein SAMN04489712_105282 [Thermomonospora echinospora]